MADEKPDEKPPVPLGAQVARKMYSGLKNLVGEITKMSAGLDDCPAKAMIGEHIAGVSGAMDGLGKGWAKCYKDLDLEEAESDAGKDPKAKAGDLVPEPNNKPAEKPEEKRQIVKDDMGEEDDEDGMTPAEKSLVLSRINRLESEIRHKERLQRVASRR